MGLRAFQSARRRLSFGGRNHIGDDFAEGSGVLRRSEIIAGRGLERKLWKYEFCEAIAFLEMRITREDEAIDAERHIFLHSFRDLVGVADERRPGAAAHEPDAGPKIGRDLQLVS